MTFAQRRRGERKWAEDEEGRIFGRGSDGGEGTCTKRSAGIDAKLEYLNSKIKFFFLVCQSVVFGSIFGFKCWGIRCPVPRLTQKEEENSWSAHRRPISLPPPPPPDKNSTRPFVPHTWEIDLCALEWRRGRTHCNFVGSASHLRSASIGVNSLEKFKSAIFLARRGIYKNFDTHMLFPNSPCKYARIIFSPSGKAQCVCIRSGRPKCYFLPRFSRAERPYLSVCRARDGGRPGPFFCPLSKACIETDERRNSFSLIAPHRPRTSYEVTGEVAQF